MRILSALSLPWTTWASPEVSGVRCEVSADKLQIPTSKLQRNFKLQAPISRGRKIVSLVIDASLELGAWNLELSYTSLRLSSL